MPTCTPTTLYQHVPKSGGTWVYSALRAHAGAVRREGGAHVAWSALSPELRALRSFGTIRDPWSWYVSWWLHALSNASCEHALHRLCGPRGGARDFRRVLRGATRPTDSSVPQDLPGLFFGPVGHSGTLGTSGVGLYSWTCREIYGVQGDGVEAVVDTSRLVAGVAEFCELDTEVLVAREPLNSAKQRRHSCGVRAPDRYADLYDDDMMRWVAEADAAVIDAAGLTPFGPARSALQAWELT